MRALTDKPTRPRPNAEAPAHTEISPVGPSYVSVCDFDPLHGEGLSYNRRLIQAGVQTELHSFPKRSTARGNPIQDAKQGQPTANRGSVTSKGRCARIEPRVPSGAARQPIVGGGVGEAVSWVAPQEESRRSPSSEGEPGSAV